MHTMLTPHLHLHTQTRPTQLELCKLVTAGRYLQFCRFVVQYPAISSGCSWNEGVVNKAWQLLANTRHHAPEHLQLIRWLYIIVKGKGRGLYWIAIFRICVLVLVNIEILNLNLIALWSNAFVRASRAKLYFLWSQHLKCQLCIDNFINIRLTKTYSWKISLNSPTEGSLASRNICKVPDEGL